MSRRRSGLPKGARTAARILRFLGAGGMGILLIVCLVVAFTAIGSKYVTTASAQTACQLPDRTGGPGVEVFGDSALLGLAHALSDTLPGGTVVEDVKPGRTAQQGETVLNELPDSAPGVFVISLAEDDASNTAYTARIDELRLLLRGRRVYWVTAPGKDAYTKIVNSENTTPDPGAPETVGKWLELTVPPFGRTRTAGDGPRPGRGTAWWWHPVSYLAARRQRFARPHPGCGTAPAMRKWSAWTELSHSGQVGRAQSVVPVPCTCPTHRACAGSCGHSRTAPERRSTRDFGG